MWALVINPVSGQGKGTTVGTYVAGYLNQKKISFTIVTGNSSISLGDHLRTFIDKNYQRTEAILKANLDVLHTMAAALMKYETIDKSQIDDLMSRKPVRDPAGWNDALPRGGLHIVVGDAKNDNELPPSLDKTVEQN